MRHALCVLLFFILLAPGVIRAEKEITLGTVEEVILLPWGVKLLARIDTGATTTSLDARELKIEGKVVEFRLPDQYEGGPFRLPIIEWKEVLSAEGARTKARGGYGSLHRFQANTRPSQSQRPFRG